MTPPPAILGGTAAIGSALFYHDAPFLAGWLACVAAIFAITGIVKWMAA